MDPNFGAEISEHYHQVRGERAFRNKMAYYEGMILGAIKPHNQRYYRYN